MSPAGPADRLEAVRVRIQRAARRAGRDPATVRLVGISKRQPAERIAAVVRAGLRELGESYVQEARDKLPQIRGLLEETLFNRLTWHMVGRLQRNKVREALERFAEIHSVDRLALAEEISRRADPARPVRVYLQVNLSGEPQKGGVQPEDLEDLFRRTAALPGLAVVGLMTVPAPAPDPEASRPTFRRLAALREDLRRSAPGVELPHLSMGMSGDFEVAIEEGATVVRVGTALFGPRDRGGSDG